MHEFTEEVEVSAAMEATAQGLTLTVTPVAPGIEVEVDRQLLAGAVVNLLQNAFKFTRPRATSPSRRPRPATECSSPSKTSAAVCHRARPKNCFDHSNSRAPTEGAWVSVGLPRHSLDL
jgi:predicted signal transduction protein with EAL and GGDEF domain